MIISSMKNVFLVDWKAVAIQGSDECTQLERHVLYPIKRKILS